MLTARTEDADRITGLDGGADDYLPKPFNPDELASRMRAILRRVGHSSAANRELSFGGLRIDSITRRVWIADRDVGLTSLEFDLLLFLARSNGRVVSRDEVAIALYQRESNPFDRALDVHISHLRTKLGQYCGCIRTVRGEGYTFASEPE
jgi:DNA-binding response OmpR family regulator